MIASLSGQLQLKNPSVLVLDVGGVGYEVHISLRTFDVLPEVGEACFLLIQTVVREDAILLYGFHQPEEKELFLLLVAVSGIGPKLAQTILSGIGVAALCQAIRQKDIAQLTSISGVGKKTAQRLCVELAEKVGSFEADQEVAGAGSAPVTVTEADVLADAASALVNLGYPQSMAWQALRAVEKGLGKDAASVRVEELIRLALQSLATRS
ncbi:Holliday junction branch migration protein RuvA [Desulfobulbus rhabdoformis]|uniref:Holliday junction branch migration protein RuvA n=1 Tax=Desulfobulbus rhabdoformis TaxID=34032 RepID=UPI001965A685|nr:Holliday junction branch migration protein RuvA [Desulfobulbus rhabdoformis]MBM9613288.1 Holliday junction branch migration protein RuvA [Desulfobulbus rhabdoformis]